MDKKTQDVLKGRFMKAIKKSFRPCPLIGEKWFHFHPEGKPADLQFLGCQKLAKAMGRNATYVAQTIIKNLYLRDIEASIEITSDARINLRLQKPAGGKDEPSSSD
jgi:arginyl-tRNA synthetase